uniref:Pyrin domain-containing protein n=1 Tax=Astyanax mexicanus TaxID=7994 RepID=A0A3B1K329_ASTMX
MAPSTGLHTLEDLGAEKFKKFISKMTDPGLETRVAKGAVEGKDCGDIANLLIEHFTESRALEITLQIMRNIKANQTAENLEKEAAGKEDAPTTETELLNSEMREGRHSSPTV